jgi:glycosyltransferase involved in cell wall biosynthesis
MKVSIIIPTLNRSSLLRKTLTSLCRQNFPADQFEIVVIDNGSTDDTQEVVVSFIDKYPDHEIHYFYEPETGNLAGRHRGAREARGELFAFVDDDIEAVPGWLTAVVTGFDDVKVQVVGGRILPKYEVTPPGWLESFWETTPHGGRLCGYLSLLDLGLNSIRISPDYIWSANLSIRRRTFYDLGGFNPDTVPDHLLRFCGNGETGLMIKVKARDEVTIYRPEATVFHFVPADRMTPEYFERRAYVEGIRESYSTVRHDGGLRVPLPVKLWRLAGNLKGLARGRMMIWRHDKAIRVLHAQVHRAHRAGFKFHQRAICADPEVLDWVLRPDYLEYRLPTVIPAEPRQLASMAADPRKVST